MDKIHRPALVHGLWDGKRLGLFTDQAFLRLDPQVELERSVDAIHALVIPAESFDVAQIQIAEPEAPVALVVR